MTRPMIRIHNVETGEIVDREMNNDEYEQFKKDIALKEIREAEFEAKAQTKAALLQRLGITEEEAKLLLG